MFPLEFRGEVNHKELSHGAILSEDRMIVAGVISIPDTGLWQTDRRSDRIYHS